MAKTAFPTADAAYKRVTPVCELGFKAAPAIVNPSTATVKILEVHTKPVEPSSLIETAVITGEAITYVVTAALTPKMMFPTKANSSSASTEGLPTRR
jgi:hypothetical protein